MGYGRPVEVQINRVHVLQRMSRRADGVRPIQRKFFQKHQVAMVRLVQAQG